MEDTNIYKISLKCLINGSLEEEVEKDVNCKLYFDNKDEVESIEMFSRRKIAEYFEKYIESKDKWEIIEIMIYWDKKSEIGYEITTGMPIPLLVVNNQKNHSQNDKEKESEQNEKQLNYYNYSKISRYGYFGQVTHHTERKKSKKNKLRTSRKRLNQLKKYIQDNSFETNSDIISFQARLNATIKDSQNYIIEIIKGMISKLEEQKQNSDEQSKNNQLVMRVDSVSAIYC